MPREKAEKKAKPEARKTGRNAPRPHVATQTNKNFVRALYISGKSQVEIAKLLEVHQETLRRYYREELDMGKARADAMVTLSILQMAVGGKGTMEEPTNWRDAVPDMAKLYAKCRMGWREARQEVNLSGAVGHYDLSKLSLDDLKRVEDILTRAAIAGAITDQGGDR